MTSSTSVIKSRDQQQAASWSPSELTAASLPLDYPVNFNFGSASEHEAEPPDAAALAQEEAEKILTLAKQQAGEIREEARQKGLQEGRAGVEKKILDASSALQSMVEQTTLWQEEYFNTGELQILGLINIITKKLFGSGFELDEVSLQNLLADLFKRARTLGDLRCFLNPRDVETLSLQWVEKQKSYHGVDITLVPDESIQPGGCTIEGVFGSLDARIENRLDMILHALEQTLPDDSGDVQ